MDPAPAAQASRFGEPRSVVSLRPSRLLAIGGAAVLLALLLGSSLGGGVVGTPGHIGTPRSNAAAAAAEAIYHPPAASARPHPGLALPATAPSSVSSTVELSSNTVLAGNQQPNNLLSLDALTNVTGSPEIIGAALTGDLGPNGTVFGYNTTKSALDQGVSSSFPNPVGLGYVPVTDSVWVADAGYTPAGSLAFTSAVGVLDLKTFTFTNLLPAGNYTYAVAYDPEGQQVAVTNLQNGQLWLYNATTFHVNAKINTGVFPVAVAYDPVAHAVVTTNELTDNLTVVNASTGFKMASVNLPGEPSAIVVGPGGLAYVGIVNQSSVAVVNVTTATVLNNLVVGRNCTSLAIDSATGILYAAGYGPTDNVTLFNLTSNHYATTWKVASGGHQIAISGVGDTIVLAQDGWNSIWTVLGTKSGVYDTETIVGSEPVAQVLDPTDGGLFSIDYYTGNVSWVDRNETRANNSIGLNLNPGTEYATWNSRRDTVWTTSTTSYHLQIFNGSTQTVTHTIQSFTYYPGFVAYDPNEDRVYNAEAGGGSVTPTSATSFASDPAIQGLPAVGAMIYDTPNGTLYVGENSNTSANPPLSRVTIINSSLDKIVGTDWVGGVVTAFGIDTENQAVYSFNRLGDNASIINGHNNQVSGSIALPAVPNGVYVSSAAFDPVDGLFYLVMSGLNQVWLLDPANGSVVQRIDVGSNPISAVYDYSGGAVVVTNAFSGTLSVIRDPARYSVTFHALGLANNVQWLIGAQNTSYVSTGATIDCFSQNTSAFAWFAYAPNYFVVPSSYGNVTVNGANVDVNVQFAPVGVPTAVQFTEQGLPFNTGWNVTVTSVGKVLHPVNQTLASKSSSLLFRVVNGTYNFSVPAIPGFVPTPKAGSFVMFATKLNITINWTESNYSVTFTEIGLPAGTSWEVTLGVLVNHSTSDQIVIWAPNGTYRYTVQPVAGYNQSAPGNVTIAGAPLAEAVTFTAIGLPSQGAGSAGSPINGALLELGLIGLAAFLIVLAVVLEMRFRRAEARLEPGTSGGPSAPEGPGEPPAE